MTKLNLNLFSTLILSASIFLSPNLSFSQDIAFNSKELIRSNRVYGTVRNNYVTQQEIERTKKISDGAIPLINEILATYTPKDFKKLKTALGKYGLINFSNSNIDSNNESTPNFFPLSELEEACVEFPDSTLCENKTLITYKGQNFFNIPKKQKFSVINFNLPTQYTQKIKQERKELEIQINQKNKNRYEDYYNQHNGIITKEFSRPDGTLGAEDTYICLKQLTNFIHNLDLSQEDFNEKRIQYNKCGDKLEDLISKKKNYIDRINNIKHRMDFNEKMSTGYFKKHGYKTPENSHLEKNSKDKLLIARYTTEMTESLDEPIKELKTKISKLENLLGKQGMLKKAKIKKFNKSNHQALNQKFNAMTVVEFFEHLPGNKYPKLLKFHKFNKNQGGITSNFVFNHIPLFLNGDDDFAFDSPRSKQKKLRKSKTRYLKYVY